MHKYELDTPVAIVDLDVMERNIYDMADFAKRRGVALRPHIKTHKVIEIAELQLRSGAVGITCAKIGEAEVMSEVADDIFLANLIVGEQKLQRLTKLLEHRFCLAVDSVEVAGPISELALKLGINLSVLIKVDVGLRRTGVAHGRPTVELAQRLSKLRGLSLIGIYTHEGHVYQAVDRDQIRETALNAGEKMVSTADMLRKEGFNIDVVSVGATPSAKITCLIDGVTEIRPGTYVFNDYNQIRLGVASESDCALSILSTVISVPEANRAVIDAGTKALTSEKVSAFGVYGLIKGIEGARLTRAYEEHGIIEFEPSLVQFKVGDKIEIIPNHVCPTVNLYDELIGVRKDLVETSWNVSARGLLK